jgi:eukaryotic-like serine/threonine-protein kinase
MPLVPGTKLGPYEILSPLGAGGMGEVYRARDTRLGRDVAVKVLPQHLSSNSEVRARFEREAKTVSSLNHPNICTLFDIGREGDTDFLVMELIEGETLAARLVKGPLPTAEVLTLGAQIADALSRAHRAGIVHRDLKPGNVMLTKSGAKLMDFGLARAPGLAGGVGSSLTMEALTQSPTVAAPLTSEGTILGTFQYMSPEQLEGKEADARSDVWALGCVLYEMATGRRAFEGKSQASLIAAILEHQPEPITSLAPMSPPALERLVQAMLAKEPDDRVQTAQDVKLQLEWMRTDGSSPTGTVPAPVIARGKQRRWMITALGLIAVTAAFLTGRMSVPRERATPLQFERKTFRTETIFDARFVRDSKTLVLSAALEGNRPRLFVIRPDYPEPQPVGADDVHLLAVSSKGELAVLNHARFTGHHRLFQGTLARTPLEGAAPRDIMEDVREADWSPDGENLAVIHEVNGNDRLEYPIGKVLVEAPGYLSEVRVSPRGDRIAYMEHPAKWDDRGSVNMVDLEGHAHILSSGYWGMEGLAWAPDGRTVLFSATLNGSDYVVHEVDLKGKLLPARQNVGLLVIHDIAPDGTWAVTRDDIPIRLWFRSAGVTEDVDRSWLDNSTSPILSGDGKTLCFTDESVAAGGNYAVTLRSTSGGDIVRLGEGQGQEFSRDGKSILAVVFSTPPRVVSYPVGAGKMAQLDGGNFENLSTAFWMPDGHVLVSGNETGKSPRCFVLDPSSHKAEVVGPEGIWGAIPSPDGRTFVARSQTGWAIYALSAAGEGHPMPSMTPADNVSRWSPDGAALYCYHQADVPSRVERIEVATGRRETVAIVGDRDRTGLVSIRAVTLADDPRTLAYGTWYYTSVLYTVGREK